MANLILPGTQDFLQVGGRIFTDLQNLIMLYGVAAGTTLTNCTMRKPAGTAGYQVPVGKIFKIKAIRMEIGATTAGSGVAISVGYADNDVGVATATAFTNAKYPGNSGSVAQTGYLTTLAGIQLSERSYDFDVVAQKYPMFGVGSTAAVTASVFYFGYEVSA